MRLVILAIGIMAISATVSAQERRVYAHPVRLDRYGVIVPWYQGQDGPLNFRVRSAGETLKRYPWATPP